MARDYSFFKTLLDSFTIEEPPDGEGRDWFDSPARREVAGIAVGKTGVQKEQEFKVWYQNQQEAGFAALCVAVQKDLKENGHLLFEEAHLDVLCIFAFMKCSIPFQENAILIAEIVDSITTYKMHWWRLWPGDRQRARLLKLV